MRAQIKLGRVFGVEIGLHYSWLIIAALIAFSLAEHFRMVNPDWTTATIWSSAIITSVLFFAGLIAHELSHAMVARSRNIPVRRITLFALGGMAHMEKEPDDASSEFWMAIAGPITSVVLGFLLLGIARATGWVARSEPLTPAVAVLVWLGYINIVLGIFNMIPGFPLDGGRVLRAIVWWATKSAEKATRIATTIGRIIGVLFIAYGVFRFFLGDGFGGLWIAFIGWFLYEAARSNYVQFEALSLLGGLRARDLMSRDCVQIDGSSTVQSFVDEQLLRNPQRCFAVMEHGRTAGIVTPQEVRALDRSRWPAAQLRDIMRPIEHLRSVGPDTSAVQAMELMSSEQLTQVPVISDHHLEGMISHTAILHALEARSELKKAS